MNNPSGSRDTPQPRRHGAAFSRRLRNTSALLPDVATCSTALGPLVPSSSAAQVVRFESMTSSVSDGHVAVYGTKAVPVPATCRTQRKQSAAAGHRPLPFTKGRPFKIPTKSVDMRHDPSRPLCANVKHLTCKCIALGTRTTSPIRNSLHVQTPTSLNCTSPYVHQEALTRQ